MKLTNEQLNTLKEITENFNKKSNVKLDYDFVKNSLKDLQTDPSQPHSYLTATNTFMSKMMDYFSFEIKDAFEKKGETDFKNLALNVEIATKDILNTTIAPYIIDQEKKAARSNLALPKNVSKQYTEEFQKTLKNRMEISLNSDKKLTVADLLVVKAHNKDTADFEMRELTTYLVDEAMNANNDVENKKISNKGYFEFMKSVRTPYTAVHKLYNEMNFFEKWFTPTGYMLRGALNSVKHAIIDYHQELAEKNIENKHKYSKEDQDYICENKISDNKIPTVVHKDIWMTEYNIGDISAMLNRSQSRSRVEINLDDECKMEYETTKNSKATELEKAFIPEIPEK